MLATLEYKMDEASFVCDRVQANYTSAYISGTRAYGNANYTVSLHRRVSGQ